MKKKYLGLMMAVLLGITPVTSMIHPTSVEAAAYGRGTKFTVPKAYRGTWYNYNSQLANKIKITTHTFNGQTVYSKKRDKMAKSVGNLTGARYVKIEGKKYIFFIPWLANIGDGNFRATTKKINGHKRRVLICKANFFGMDMSTVYYPNKALAKQMKK